MSSDEESQILALDDGTFPALLKLLSDESDEVCLNRRLERKRRSLLS